MFPKSSKREMILLGLVLQALVFYGYYRYTHQAPVWSAPSQHKITFKSNIEAYPDLMVAFRFHRPPSDSLIRQMSAFTSAYADRYQAYISEISCDSDELEYHMLCDFQATPYSEGVLIDFVNGINAIDGRENIDSVTIE